MTTCSTFTNSLPFGFQFLSKWHEHVARESLNDIKTHQLDGSHHVKYSAGSTCSGRQASVQLPPQERENRNRLIIHYARYQVYTAAEILQMLAIIHGYVLRYVTYKQLQE